MRRLVYIPVILVLFLGGCAEWAARLMEDAAYLHQSGRAYVFETHDLRRFIREECKASLVREIDTLKLSGDEAALRQMLAANYPGLVTTSIIDEARENPSSILAEAPGCK